MIPNTGQYLYDANANMTYDPSKKITVSYNPLYLPRLVEFDNSDFIEYTYTATGTKLRKTVTSWKTTTGGTTDYAGQFLYRDNELSCIFTPVGRIVPMQYNDETFWKHEYNLKDHLGNTRIVFAAHPHGQPEVMQQTSYYPFGMTLQLQNFGGALNPPNKLLYNSKELQDDELAGVSLDWYDYGARFYDAALGRWHSVDPLAESYYSQSAYHFSGNNPMRFLDLNGMNYGDFYKTDGTWLGSDGIDDDKAYTADAVTTNNEGVVTGATNSTELSVSNSELVQLAATSYGEGSAKNNEKEMSGISSVIARQADARGEAISDLLSSSNTYAFAASDVNKRFGNFKEATATGRNDNKGMKLALKGAINAVTGGTDYSNGAYFWDGADISTNYINHAKIKSGFKITDASHNIYKISNSSVDVTTYWYNSAGKATGTRGTYTHTYQSTAGHGGTIFSKYTKEFLKATGNKVYK